MSKIQEPERSDLSYDQVERLIKNLQGKVLTQLEASIEDKSKLKAVKSIINDHFSTTLEYTASLHFPNLPVMTYDAVSALYGEPDLLERDSE